MKRIGLCILIVIVIISGCGNRDANINKISDNNTQTSIEPGSENDNESLNPADANAEKEILSHWLGQNPDYTIDLNNYDINNEKERYLLQVKFEYEVDTNKYESTDYFIDVDEINRLEGYYEIAGRSIIPEELEHPNLSFSEDGRRVLLLDQYGEENIVEVIDIIGRKVLYQYKTKDKLFNRYLYNVVPSADLEHLMIAVEDGTMFVDVLNKKVMLRQCSAEIISPDGTKSAVIHSENDINILKIYDLATEELIDLIKFDKGIMYLVQWHESNKILFYTFEGSFYYDLDTKETKLIAPYFYSPIMSPDGKYVALTRDDRYGVLDYTETVEYELYRQYSCDEGLYVKNMVTNELIQVAPLIYGNGYSAQIPMQWVYVNKNFDNNKNRWCSPADKEGEYAAYSSSLSAENVIDGDIHTAWVEYEERNNTEQEEKYDGKGIGEWIKIYKKTKAKLEYRKGERGYYTDVDIGYTDSMLLSGIKIINGYAKSREIYLANNRVKKAEVILSDGTSYVFDLEDNNLGFQTLDFGKEIETRQVVIKILDIYEGNKYNDTCISEVELIEAEKKP
ncbi:MAG: NADase-type glycan-binding domain-containing protein [Acetivibrionales bacterium]|jgi:hypothetical protein